LFFIWQAFKNGQREDGGYDPKILLVRESVILLRKINIFYYERKKVEYNSISVKVYDNNKWSYTFDTLNSHSHENDYSSI